MKLSTVNKAKEYTERTLLLSKNNLAINYAPQMIMVNGFYVASTFKEFEDFCTRLGLHSTDFKNWPFIATF